MDLDELHELLKNFRGIVVVMKLTGILRKLGYKWVIEYPNAVVLKTFSKAMGLAGLRVGYLIGNKDWLIRSIL